jgi:hypothetical protein
MLIFSNNTLFNTWVSNHTVNATGGLAYRLVPNLSVNGGFSTGSMSKSDPAQFPSRGGITNCDIMFMNLGNTSIVDMTYSVTVEWDSFGRLILPALLIALPVMAVIATTCIVLTKRKHSALRESLTMKNTSA